MLDKNGWVELDWADYITLLMLIPAIFICLFEENYIECYEYSGYYAIYKWFGLA